MWGVCQNMFCICYLNRNWQRGKECRGIAMRSSVIKIVNTLHKNKKMYILTGVIAALLVIFYALFAWYTVGKYELISEQI